VAGVDIQTGIGAQAHRGWIFTSSRSRSAGEAALA